MARFLSARPARPCAAVTLVLGSPANGNDRPHALGPATRASSGCLGGAPRGTLLRPQGDVSSQPTGRSGRAVNNEISLMPRPLGRAALSAGLLLLKDFPRWSQRLGLKSDSPEVRTRYQGPPCQRFQKLQTRPKWICSETFPNRPPACKPAVCAARIPRARASCGTTEEINPVRAPREKSAGRVRSHHIFIVMGREFLYEEHKGCVLCKGSPVIST